MRSSINFMAPTRTTLFAILFLSFTVKVLIIWLLPSLHHPDENFQLFEQGHVIAFGYGISPWEFREGIRSLVLPSALAGIYRTASLITDRPDIYIGLARVVLAGVSLGAVAALYCYGSCRSRLHALIPAAALAFWFEAVYFSVRPLNEALASSFLLCAICFGLLACENLRERYFLLAGLFASLVVTLRLHLAPGVLVLAIWVCRFDIRHRWLPFLLGTLPAFVVFGVADWIAWGAPFSSFIGYVQVNLVDGKASEFGVEPFWWYCEQIWDNWSFFVPVSVLLVLYSLRANSLWLLVSVSIILSHSFIPHKEYRFVYPAIICLIVAAALGSASVTQSLVRIYPKRGSQFTAFAIFLWITTSLVLAVSPSYSENWRSSQENIRAFYYLYQQKDLCGLILHRNDWWDTGGYAHLHRNVPMYATENYNFEIKKVSQLGNYVLAPENSVHEVPDQYGIVQCFGEDETSRTCLLKRPGSCAVRDEVISLARQAG
jgi:phosphatidylinositol glycan class B